jgi:hypothetical protein
LSSSHAIEPKITVAVRTLLAAGHTITGTHRQPRHVEIQSQRKDVLGATIPYLIALTDEDEFSPDEIGDIRRSAQNQSRALVAIARLPGSDWISWDDFTEALGGAVPSWQALSPEYSAALIIASKNRLPIGMTGDAWLIFEDLVSYGLEFVFGRRVRRLGGRTRGRRVSDIQAQTPQERIVVVDAKAADGKGFNVTWPELRPLIEYVARQKDRQRGQLAVTGALVVSSQFPQPAERLQELSNQFLAETSVPVSFLRAEDLRRVVEVLTANVQARNAIRWNQILKGGLVNIQEFDRELNAVGSERILRGA